MLNQFGSLVMQSFLVNSFMAGMAQCNQLEQELIPDMRIAEVVHLLR